MNSTFKDELKIIPQGARFAAFAVGLCTVIALFFAAAVNHNSPRPLVPVLALILGCGAVVICWILLLGYVNADANRRGMSGLLWTLICAFVPNLIGFIIYFLLRQPLSTLCNKCGFTVEHGFRYCPRCSSPQVPICSSCGHALQPEYACCPYCGQAVGTAGPPAVIPG